MNNAIDKLIRTVSALTVRSPVPLSFDKKKSAENKLATIMKSTTTIATLIHMILFTLVKVRLSIPRYKNAI